MDINNSFYKCLKEKNNLFDAYTVIKNYFSKDTSNEVYFSDYIESALTLAKLDIDFNDRKQYIYECNNALAIFSESVEMNEETLEIINNTKMILQENFNNICNEEEEFYSKNEIKIQNENTKLLDKLSNVKLEISNVKTQLALDKLLAEVVEIENCLNKDYFTLEQNKIYETLTKHYSNTISSKMEELNKNMLLEMNKKAVKSFKEAFDSFTKRKSWYKDTESNLKALVVSKLFTYDSSKLFNETLIYYNHVYALIFQEVSDELKFKLTEWSIQTTKIK